jgi:purine-cytosine permease-like protein
MEYQAEPVIDMMDKTKDGIPYNSYKGEIACVLACYAIAMVTTLGVIAGAFIQNYIITSEFMFLLVVVVPYQLIMVVSFWFLCREENKEIESARRVYGGNE